MLTQQELKSLLHYDPDTGVFRWRHQPHRSRVLPWTVAGATQKDGYRRIGIDGSTYAAHRLAWLYATGEDLVHEVDHIDGNRDNNAVSNLRIASRKQNCENLKSNARNTSGFRGVTKHSSGRWQAQLKHDRKGIYLGLFATVEQAADAVRAKRAELFTHDHGRAA